MISHLRIKQIFLFLAVIFFLLLPQVMCVHGVCMIIQFLSLQTHISRSRCPAIPKVTATPLQEEQIPILLHLIIIPIPTEVIIIKMITVLHIITVELDTLNITLLLEAPQNHTAQRSKRIGLLVAPVLRSLSSAKLLFLDREG
jgi:hypothetical protein